MPTSVGPNTFGEENLVFGYDLGDVQNSYKGEPTTNLITDTAAFDSSFWNQKNGTITANAAIGPRGTQNAAKIVATNTDPYIYSSAIVTASTGNNTWSIWVKGEGSTVGKSAQVRINFSGTATGTADTNASLNLTEYWQLLQTTANVTGAGTIKFGLEAPNGAVSGDVMYFADPMFEQKSHATQFVNSTRSATQGLIDLKGNSTIDLTNVSFDSNAQMTFDGTNDYVDLGSDIVISPNNQGWTAEYVFNTNSASTLQHFNSAEADDFNANWLALLSSKLAVWDHGQGTWRYGNTQFSSNTWYHVAFVQTSSTTMQFYVNGEAEGGDHTSFSWSPTYSALKTRYIGRYEYNGSYGRYFNGEIPLTKLYSRALTAQEIKANYNAVKGRFM